MGRQRPSGASVENSESKVHRYSFRGLYFSRLWLYCLGFTLTCITNSKRPFIDQLPRTDTALSTYNIYIYIYLQVGALIYQVGALIYLVVYLYLLNLECKIAAPGLLAVEGISRAPPQHSCLDRSAVSAGRAVFSALAEAAACVQTYVLCNMYYNGMYACMYMYKPWSEVLIRGGIA